LPLVPLVVIAASLFFVRVRSRLARPVLADAAAAIWLTVAFVLPLTAYARERVRLRDSRRQAMDWLVAHARPQDEVLVVRDLGILNQELARLPARPTTRWGEQVEETVRELRPRFVVGGILSHPDATSTVVAGLPSLAREYAERFRAGVKPTVPVRSWWRDNDQIVVILERPMR
jgi:hypothetical protein